MLSAMSSTVHVARHGEVENPQKILYGRQPGWRLSSRGQEMAEVLGQWSKSIDLGALHVSPLQRAQETAAPIAKAHGITITTDDRLIEAANIFEGKPFDPMPRLMAIAEYVTKVHAICMKCGDLAAFSYRLSAAKEKVMLGEKDSYEARCRKCFQEDQS